MRSGLSWGLALFSLLAAAASQAADLPSSAAPTARRMPVAAPAYSWQGFYVGGNVGYSWGPWDGTGSGVSPTGTYKASVDGWIGGLQAGYNWQFNKNWIAGLEGDFQWSGEKHNFTWVFPIVIGDARSGFTIAESWKLQWLATFRGRLGYAPSPDWMIYGTGGAAAGKLSYNVALSLGALSLALSDEKTKWGWTIGGGAEKKIDKNWSGKVEYLYVDLGNYKFVQSIDSKIRDHVLRIGVNYKFN